MWLTPPTPVPVTQIYTPPYFCPIVISIPIPVLQFSLHPHFTVFLVPPFTVFCAVFLVSLSYSFPQSPVLQFSLIPLSHSFPWFPFLATLTPFLDMDPSRISNAHLLLAYKPHVAGRGGASSFLFVLQPLLTVQSTDKSCISCYLAIHHFCYYITERLPTCLCPVQWYCYLSCDLLGRLIY